MNFTLKKTWVLHESEISLFPVGVQVTLWTPTTMTSKGAKETIVTRLGFKSSSSASKAEAELEKVRKENAHLRRKIDELAKRHVKPPDSDKSKLLEVKEAIDLSVVLRDFRVRSRLPCVSGCAFFLCVPHVHYFRGFFPSRRCERGTISSCLLKSRN